MVIYGLGEKTKVLLESFPHFHIVGLMDEVRTGDTVWGLPVISCEEARERHAELILILARAANVSVIYRRIAKKCEKYNIPVYDIAGNRMGKRKGRERYVLPKFYETHGKEALMEKIRRAEVVSFDIFDTLLMRSVSEETEIFLATEKQAKKEGIIGPDVPFAKHRRNAERELGLSGAPSICDIYRRLTEYGTITKAQSEVLREIEIEEERKGLLPRRAVVDILRECERQKKILCCTSDMYLSGEILSRILLEHGIKTDALLLSCEEGVSKSRGLFDKLKHRYPGKRILHIGDSEEADIRSARQSGIDDVFQIPGPRRMLEDSVASALLDYVEAPEDRREVGQFLARQMEDPFLFDRTKGKLEIRSYYDIGHDFIEPMMASFLCWLIEECETEDIDMLMLGARDGWVLVKLFDILSQERSLPFSYRYLPASRTACALAGMETKEDVAYAASKAFAGTAEELLQKRFQLGMDDLLPRRGKETETDYVLRHADRILERGKIHRENYQKAVYALGIRAGQKKGYFDFVTAGTCQFWLEKIMGEHLMGFCFIRFLSPEMEGMAIHPFLTETFPNREESGWHLLDNYFLIESFLSAPTPFLLRIGDNGEAVYDKECRTPRQRMNMEMLHRGIQAGFRERLKEGRKPPKSKKMLDFLIHLLQKTYTVSLMEDFQGTMVTDEFCNRTFQVN